MAGFRYFLQPDQGSYFVVDNNGNVGIVPQKTPQKDLPIDWLTNQVSFKRNMTRYGMFIQYSLPFQFVKDSATIMRYLWHGSNGCESVCIVTIEELNTTTMEYELFYQGTLNFYTAQDLFDRFTIQVLDKGASEVFKSNSGVSVTVPLDLPQAITCELKGVNLGAQIGWVLGDSSQSSTIYPPIQHVINGVVTGSAMNLPSQIISNTQQGVFVTANNARFIPYNIPAPPNLGRDSSALSMSAQTDLTQAVISGTIGFQCVADNASGGATGYFFNVRANVIDFGAYTDPLGNTFGYHIDSSTIIATTQVIAPSTFTVFNLPLSGTIPLISATQSLSFEVEIVTVGGSSPTANWKAYYYTESSNVIINYLAKVPPTNCKMLGILDTLKYVVNNISQGTVGVISDYLSNTDSSSAARFNNWDSIAYNVKYTSGNGLRQEIGAAIVTSLDEITQDLFSTYCLGVGVDASNSNLVIEPVSYFFRDELICEIDTVDHAVIDPISGYINAVSIGYEYSATGTQNIVGKNEFNTTTNYLADSVKGVDNGDNLVSEISPSVYLIEGMRANSLFTQKADNTTDNTTFKIELDPISVSGIYHPLIGGGVITGVDDPTNIYNPRLSPARCEYRHLPLHRSIISSGNFVFQSTILNPNLVSTFESGQIVETDTIPLDLDTVKGHDVSRIFGSKSITINCNPPFNIYKLVTANPLGYVLFPYFGNKIRMFILNLDYTAGTRACAISGFPHPADVSKLIR